MKTLLIMRHAKSSWGDPRLTDHDRPLKKRGKRDAPLMGRLLSDRGIVPDLILSSSAKRALATAKSTAKSAGYEGVVEVGKELYLAGPRGYIVRLRLVSDEVRRVMIVGHNPGLEDLLESLTKSWRRMPTAAIAEVSLPIDSWKNLELDTSGKLRNYWTPRELREQDRSYHGGRQQ